MMNGIYFLLSICVVVGVLAYFVWLALSGLYIVLHYIWKKVTTWK